jgi:hypothetical protein
MSRVQARAEPLRQPNAHGASWMRQASGSGCETRMAKSMRDAGWGILKSYLRYKGRQVRAHRQREKYDANMQQLQGLSDPSGLGMLVVRIWVCRECL